MTAQGEAGRRGFDPGSPAVIGIRHTAYVACALEALHDSGHACRVGAELDGEVDLPLLAGKGALPASIELRGGTDRIVTIADGAAEQLGVVFTAGPEQRSAADLAAVVDRLARGELIATVAAVFPFTEAAAAHRLSDGGHAGGKVVLVP
ncbi:zinc-binding dehydrogenase [Micromonospora sp. NPDC051006]|uniref:zinc-binding dehydrogenase n=1 Tax=Micromonospora sp. NPDC051006 TaxID=3364283 RepID=UPI0037B3F9ED